MESENPFQVGVLADAERFADRRSELARITRALRSPGDKLFVYGDRRLGKSSALEAAAVAVRREGGLVAIASFATASDPAEAAQQVLRAVQAEIGRNARDVLEGIAARLRARLQVEPSPTPGGPPVIAFTFALAQPEQRTRLLPEVLTALEEQLAERGLVLGLGLDEFQRIHEWGGEDAEWALREVLQRQRHVAYVLAGSKRHLIEAMVGRKGRALWKIGDVLPFGPIPPSEMAEWIARESTRADVHMTRKQADRVVALAGPRTRDIAQLARGVWFRARGSGAVGAADVDVAFEALVEEQAELFRALWSGLSARQQGVLRAFAAEPDVQITAARTAHAYHLGPKSSVQTALDALVEAEHLARPASGGYVFDDPFFRRWVQVNALPDLGLPVPPLGPAAT
ncbi:MAG TPA: hypothetical protein VFQ38_11015 [Longimicrobiales bacterium]|nr:hypothetical protein [Longimicrobiales bacterium]